MAKFRGYSPLIKQFKDGGFRIQFEVSADDYDSIKDLVKLQNQVLAITVETEIESEDRPNQKQYARSQLLLEELWPDELQREVEKVEALEKHLGKKSRKELTRDEMERFITYLTKLVELRKERA